MILEKNGGRGLFGEVLHILTGLVLPTLFKMLYRQSPRLRRGVDRQPFRL